ncbi:DNA-damage-inducible protein D [Chryseobacterium ginsenosidimutans]|uniref:DNA damage-inducible protein D n=1 Tax=Chryseobacterium ginsenosidimutans TaxID=687846 RepID=UPI002169F390|nr:DNA damage-inducible protein D [Chryseobacterium ginsenosidimutans]MCS3867269.1 DNA-damage-inducible protein D [Chryseobacterium ginsenosidimutans]
MENKLEHNFSKFEQIEQIDQNGIEFWSARDLSKVLDYSEYRNFKPVIEKAKEACENSGEEIGNHFVEFHEMVKIGYGAERGFDDGVKLSRYACYLIVQNADPAKEVVALGQTYFAVQTRIQEIQKLDEYNQLSSEDEKRLFLRNEMVKHNIHLAATAKEAGVIKLIDYAIFQNHGYKGLYGGLDAKGIHNKKGLKKSQQILDHMNSTELAANLFRATQTEEKLKNDKIKGKADANKTHFEVGAKVRKTIQELGGTMPENLPVAESIKDVEKEKSKLEQQSKKLK